MNARLTLPLPAASASAAGHLPPARSTSREPAAFPPASPHCTSAAFHIVERDGRKRGCPLCPPPCPACRGQGFRIITDDGTRPACITCDGRGWLIREGERRHG